MRNVWRSKGEALNPKNTVPIAKHGGGSIMLSGCYAASCPGTFHKIDGIMKNEDTSKFFTLTSDQQLVG